MTEDTRFGFFKQRRVGSSNANEVLITVDEVTFEVYLSSLLLVTKCFEMSF